MVQNKSRCERDPQLSSVWNVVLNSKNLALGLTVAHSTHYIRCISLHWLQDAWHHAQLCSTILLGVHDEYRYDRISDIVQLQPWQYQPKLCTPQAGGLRGRSLQDHSHSSTHLGVNYGFTSTPRNKLTKNLLLFVQPYFFPATASSNAARMNLW